MFVNTPPSFLGQKPTAAVRGGNPQSGARPSSPHDTVTIKFGDTPAKARAAMARAQAAATQAQAEKLLKSAGSLLSPEDAEKYARENDFCGSAKDALCGAANKAAAERAKKENKNRPVTDPSVPQVKTTSWLGGTTYRPAVVETLDGEARTSWGRLVDGNGRALKPSDISGDIAVTAQGHVYKTVPGFLGPRFERVHGSEAKAAKKAAKPKKRWFW